MSCDENSARNLASESNQKAEVVAKNRIGAAKMRRDSKFDEKTSFLVSRNLR